MTKSDRSNKDRVVTAVNEGVTIMIDTVQSRDPKVPAVNSQTVTSVSTVILSMTQCVKKKKNDRFHPHL